MVFLEIIYQKVSPFIHLNCSIIADSQPSNCEQLRNLKSVTKQTLLEGALLKVVSVIYEEKYKYLLILSGEQITVE